MFETMTMVFFTFAGVLFFGAAAAIGTFMAVWKTYSIIYDTANSFFLGFLDFLSEFLLLQYQSCYSVRFLCPFGILVLLLC